MKCNNMEFGKKGLLNKVDEKKTKGSRRIEKKREYLLVLIDCKGCSHHDIIHWFMDSHTEASSFNFDHRHSDEKVELTLMLAAI